MTASGTVRLVLAERPARRDHLHGAWWPHSTDIARELAPMLLRVLTRPQPVLGVTLNRDEWPGAPLLLTPLPSRNPKISWYGLPEPHLAMLHFADHKRIALLLLPPDTPDDVARPAMLMAAAPGNCLTTTQTLTRARERALPPNPGGPQRAPWA